MNLSDYQSQGLTLLTKLNNNGMKTISYKALSKKFNNMTDIKAAKILLNALLELEKELIPNKITQAKVAIKFEELSQ
jgi:hypothetical protein